MHRADPPTTHLYCFLVSGSKYPPGYSEVPKELAGQDKPGEQREARLYKARFPLASTDIKLLHVHQKAAPGADDPLLLVGASGSPEKQSEGVLSTRRRKRSSRRPIPAAPQRRRCRDGETPAPRPTP